MPPAPRQRSDAAANRLRLLAAAERCAWAHGLDVSLQLVATEAGSGIGTLYRHFPDRPALLRALLESVVGELDAGMAQAQDVTDPYERLLAFLRVALDLNGRHPLLNELWSRVLRDDPGFRLENRWEAVTLRTVEEAKEQGRLHPDVTATDVALLPRVLSALGPFPPAVRAAQSDRLLAIFLAGMAPTARPDLARESAPPSAITEFLGGTAPG